MKLKPVQSLAALALLLASAALLVGGTSQGAAPRSKRQAQQVGQRPSKRPAQMEANQPAPPPPAGAGTLVNSMASSAVEGDGMSAEAPAPTTLGMSRPTTGGRPKLRPAPASNTEPAYDQDEADPERVRPGGAKRRRPLRPAPARQRPAYEDRDRDHDHEEADEDCDDYAEYDYGNAFRAALGPMHQLGDMMGNMFGHMQNLASGDYQDLPGGNYALASARSSGDGYSKLSSIVNRNGRTRGIVSETRNGRTQTRRIGEEADEADEQ